MVLDAAESDPGICPVFVRFPSRARDETLVAFRDVPLVAGCSASAIDEIEAQAERRVFDAGELILRQGTAAENVYVLLCGAVRVQISDPSGQSITAKLFAAPAVFGEMETLTRTTFIESVDAVRRAVVLCFSHSGFEEILAHHNLVARNLLVDVCRRFRVSAQNQAFSAFESVERRLANLLLSYARTFGVAVEGGVQIATETLTQESMALGIGVNEKSVRRTLKEWQGRGLLERRGRYYVLCDVDVFAELVGDDAPRLDYHL